MSADTGRDRSIGSVYLVSGSQAGIHLTDSETDSPDEAITVGRLVGLRMPDATIVGVTTSVTKSTHLGVPAACTIDLLGQIRANAHGARTYARGVTGYPTLGQPAVSLSHDELHLIFGCPGETVIRIGEIHQDPTTPANVKVDDLLTKHFAILGSTGVGKSSGVAVIIGAILEARPDLRIFFVDPHNEYGSCFASRAEVLTPRNLRLPFWLFNFEEFVDVLFRGRPGLEDETDILSELIPIAKAMFTGTRASADRSPIKRADPKTTGLNADTPVPYRLTDLIALIEERRGKLENRSLVFNYGRLLTRIETVRIDPRYAFMFDNANVGGDTMVDVIGQLFRVPANGKPMTVMQLAGFPAEVVDSVVSVVCRMAFELGLWSDGTVPTLLVCEEAHRYAPADRAMGFGPTRKALSRIAKEGRKYGVYMGLVTQRPAELDPTIVSQCSTVFAMRMANERDQAILKASVADAAASLLSFVPSLGTREAFGFGEGMPLPTRIRFAELPAHLIPRSEAVRSDAFSAAGADRNHIASVVERWRGAGARQAAQPEETLLVQAAAASPERAPIRPQVQVAPVQAAPVSPSALRSATFPQKFGAR